MQKILPPQNSSQDGIESSSSSSAKSKQVTEAATTTTTMTEANDEAASYKNEVEGYQCYLTLKAYLCAEELGGTDEEVKLLRTLKAFHGWTDQTMKNLSETMKADVKANLLLVSGNEGKPLDGKIVWDKAMEYKNEITNVLLGIWDSHCTPNGTSDLEVSFELLRTYLWLLKQIEANEMKLKENPNARVAKPNIKNCPKEWTCCILFAFRKLQGEKWGLWGFSQNKKPNTEKWTLLLGKPKGPKRQRYRSYKEKKASAERNKRARAFAETSAKSRKFMDMILEHQRLERCLRLAVGDKNSARGKNILKKLARQQMKAMDKEMAELEKL